MKTLILTTVMTLLMASMSPAQGAMEEEHDHDHHHHNHRNEFGMANSLVYLGADDEFSYGLHLHFVRNIGESRFGAGLGYERIFDEHKHNTIGLVGSFRATERLIFNLSPGIAFEGAETDHLSFAMHIESTYEFQIRKLHIGPLVEFAFDAEDYHISLGLHLGLGF